MTDLTPDRLDQIEKAASAEIEARTRPGGQLGRIREEWGDYLRATPPEVALALVNRVRELEAQVERVKAEVSAEIQRARPRAGESSFDATRRSVSRAITGRLIKALGEESQ